jgi:ABC-2 type transport system permease protein
VSLAWAYARAETVQLLRVPVYAFTTLAFPVAGLVLFGQQFVHGEPERMLAGFAATSVLAISFFQFGVGIAADRMFQWETYLRTLPAGAGTRLAGRVLSALGFSAVAVGAVSVAAIALYDARPAPWRVAALVVALLLGGVPFAFLGLALGYWLPPRAALPAANLLFLPLAIGGFLWARPPDNLPRIADLASQAVPTRNWAEVLDPIATREGVLPWYHVVALAGWTCTFAGIAWWGYVRDEGERFT